MTRLSGLLSVFRNGRHPGEPEPTGRKVMRRIRYGIVIAACVVTLQSVLLVAGAWRNDRQIERHLLGRR